MIQYHAILALEKTGTSIYNIGTRFHRDQLPRVPEVQVNISNFKVGSSSLVVPTVGLAFDNSSI
jgi:hypothetical protein